MVLLSTDPINLNHDWVMSSRNVSVLHLITQSYPCQMLKEGQRKIFTSKYKVTYFL
jgi:hypothetical protein